MRKRGKRRKIREREKKVCIREKTEGKLEIDGRKIDRERKKDDVGCKNMNVADGKMNIYIMENSCKICRFWNLGLIGYQWKLR